MKNRYSMIIQIVKNDMLGAQPSKQPNNLLNSNEKKLLLLGSYYGFSIYLMTCFSSTVLSSTLLIESGMKGKLITMNQKT